MSFGQPENDDKLGQLLAAKADISLAPVLLIALTSRCSF
jgi:hypothetical protein